MKGIKVYVGFCDDVPHWDKAGETQRDSGYCVCKTRKAARSMYQDVREMRLVPVKRPSQSRLETPTKELP